MYTLIVRPDQISVPNNSVGRAPDWRFRGPRFKSLTVPSLFLPSCHNTIVCLKIFMQHVRTTFNKNRHTCERTAIEIDVKGKFFKILSFTRQSLSFFPWKISCGNLSCRILTYFLHLKVSLNSLHSFST